MKKNSFFFILAALFFSGHRADVSKALFYNIFSDLLCRDLPVRRFGGFFAFRRGRRADGCAVHCRHDLGAVYIPEAQPARAGAG